MYAVQWTQRAADELAELWLEADSPTRRQITKAVQSFDQSLRREPAQIGESRSNPSERIVFIGGIIITFRIDFSNHIVHINGVRNVSR